MIDRQRDIIEQLRRQYADESGRMNDPVKSNSTKPERLLHIATFLGTCMRAFQEAGMGMSALAMQEAMDVLMGQPGVVDAGIDLLKEEITRPYGNRPR